MCQLVGVQPTALMHLRNLECKIYGDLEIVSEQTKRQREVLEYLEIKILDKPST
jgi:hypothetical protein